MWLEESEGKVRDMVRKCQRCRVEIPVDAKSPLCSECQIWKRDYMKRWWAEHPFRKKSYNKQYRFDHKEQLRKKKRKRYLKNIEEERQKRREWNKKNPHYTRNRIRVIRSLILTKLGNRCVICGNGDPRVLQIDHINGKGCEERRKLGTSGLSNKLIKLNEIELRQNYQLLCANCNSIKRYEKMEYQSATTVGRKKK